MSAITPSPVVSADLAARDVEIVCCNSCCPAFLRRTGTTPDIKKSKSNSIAPFTTDSKTSTVAEVRLEYIPDTNTGKPK